MSRVEIITVILLCVECVFSNNEYRYEDYISTVPKEIEKSHSFIGPQDASSHKPISDEIIDYQKSFDYVIIGGGSAGAVVANRLSEDSDKSVLLLEAGGDETTFGNIPGTTIFLQAQEFNWNFNSTPQNSSCLAMINQECSYPRGKGLGGTSLINALVYSRGNKEDYENWEKLGNKGWGYNHVLHYFNKSQNCNIKGDAGYHGMGGYLNVEYHKPDSPQLNAFIEANKLLGQKVVDYNGESQIGVGKTQFNYINGKRQSTAKAFLHPVRSRSNLEILTNSYAVQVLIDAKSRSAYGVLFTHNGIMYKVLALSEIVLSAGVIGTPHLLMLSGIGPKNHLKSLGIPIIQNLPVGNYFYEHPAYHALHFSTNYTEPIKSMEEYVKDFMDGHGPYTIDANLQGIAFYKSKYNSDLHSQNPDIEILIQPSNNTGSFIQRVHHYDDHAFETIWKKIKPQHSFTLLCILLHPLSEGRIRLKSNDPYEYPLIDTQILSDDNGRDIAIMHEAIQIALELVQTEPFKKLNATLLDHPLPICVNKHKYLSQEYWYCQLRQLTFHLFHGTSTCRMGQEPLTSVVDHKLKVHGIQNLRVVDTSIFPTQVAGHTNAPAIMVAEKASDLIKRSASFLPFSSSRSCGSPTICSIFGLALSCV
ncbi:hypothetical protein FQA39_LY06036 [Lamprigera yunnana]|nr:hypothetical protein FQA39_LY06036 [Lamprigera yunnana]